MKNRNKAENIPRNKEVKKLIHVIDEILPNTYVVVGYTAIDEEQEALYIKDRETGKHFEIKVSESE